MQVLAQIDLSRVLQCAHDRSHREVEIYGEMTRTAEIEWEQGLSSVRLRHSGGTALQSLLQGRALHLSTSQHSTEGLIALLQESAPALPSLTPPLHSSKPQLWESEQRLLGEIGRGAALGREVPKLRYLEQRREFQFADAEHPPAGGVATECSLTATWGHQHSETFWGTDPQTFLRRLKEEKTLEFHRDRLLLRKSPWPAPSGSLPIHWTSNALAGWMMQFLRAFEGDLVLKQLSFLTHFPLPLKTSLKVFDNSNGIDHEGSERKPVCLLDEGKPRALACDRSIAKELSVKSTGHCRRESFRHRSTVGLWSPRIQGPEESEDLLKGMEKGLHVDEVEVRKFDPSTGEIDLELCYPRLIHGGELGEAVSNVRLRQNVIGLIQTLEAYTAPAEVILPHRKFQQSWLTQMEAPSAISEPLEVEGEVSTSQYW